MDTEFWNGLQAVMRCSKKLCYILAWEQMMPYSIYQKVGVGEQGMTNSGFEIWTVWCIFDHKYKNKSTIAA